MMAEQPALFSMPQTARTSDDYWTPKWIFDLLAVEFDIDVACPPEGPAHTPCKQFFTQADDGLTQPWEGRVWMNPPFSKCDPWARKFMQHANGIALTVVGKTKWCNELWAKADGVHILRSDLKFVQGTIFLPTVLWAFGEDNVEALRRLGPVR